MVIYSKCSAPIFSIVLGVLAVLAANPASTAGQTVLPAKTQTIGQSYGNDVFTSQLGGICSACDSDVDVSCGPDRCEPRGTLMQWSYGTSFSGGPDQDSPLVTDRPDFTEAGSTVGLGVAQFEIGYTYVYDEVTGISPRLKRNLPGSNMNRLPELADAANQERRS